jgi:amino acid adenylation domain-containing protein
MRHHEPNIDGVKMTNDQETAVHRIAERCRSVPHRTAVIDADGHLTFEQLARESTKLSWSLTHEGVGKGDRVCIAIEPGCEFVIACVAIWSAGGVIVPLELQWPAERVRVLIEIVTPRLVLTSKRSRSQNDAVAASGIAVHAFEMAGAAQGGPDARIERLPHAADAAYVVFTSGSTGRPKAIEGRHDSLLHFLAWETREFRLDEGCRTIQLAPPSFDVSLRDIWLPIMNGGCVVVPAKHVRQSPRLLLESIVTNSIRVLHVVPSVLRLLLDEVEHDARDMRNRLSLSVIACAGERLLGRDVHRVRTLLGEEIDLCNFYGPSEMTLAQVIFHVREHQIAPGETVPLGRPIHGVAVRIREGEKNVPEGLVGEIVVASEYPTNGYIGDAELNARLFSKDTGEAGKVVTLYRTGDLGKIRDDGCLTFEGRRDFQLKVHGNRVDPYEIEVALAELGLTEQAVVSSRLSARGDTELVAFYVSTDGVSSEQLRAELARRLPRYMIPSRIVRVDRVPLNANGKVNRDQLLRSLEGNEHGADHLNAGCADASSGLMQILRDLLAIEINGQASFAELGGSSLDAMRLVARIRRELRKDVSVSDILGAATIDDVDRMVQSRPAVQQEQAINVGRDLDRCPISVYQQPLYQISEYPAGRHAYIERVAYEIRGDLDVAACEMALRNVVEAQSILRSRFVRRGAQVDQEVMKDEQAFPKLNVVDLAQKDGLVWRELLDAEASSLCDLGSAPPWCASLYRIDQRTYVLTAAFNHILLDAVGLWNLMCLLVKNYWHYSGRDSAAVQVGGPQYIDYCASERGALQEQAGHLDAAFRYWRDVLAPRPAIVDLGAGKRPIFKTYRGRTITRNAEFGRVTKVASSLRETRFTVLVATYIALLHLETDECDITIGTPILLRDRVETRDMIGFFLNMVPIRVKVEPAGVLADMIRSVASRLGGIHAHKEYPFELMARRCAEGYALDRSPLFDCVMTFLPMPESYVGEWAGSGLKARTIDLESSTAKYDLTFHLRELRDGLYVQVEYNTDVVTHERAAGMLKTYVSMLEVLDERQIIERLGRESPFGELRCGSDIPAKAIG